MNRCKRIRGDDGKWFWIPGCMARANDDGDCTCDPRKGSNRDLEQRVVKLEACVDSLVTTLHELRMKIRDLAA